MRIIIVLLLSFLLSGCGLSQLEGGSYGRNVYTAPPEENSIIVTLRYLDTWANFHSIEYVFKAEGDIFEIEVYKKGKKVAWGHGSKEEAKKIIDFLSNWLAEK